MHALSPAGAAEFIRHIINVQERSAHAYNDARSLRDAGNDFLATRTFERAANLYAISLKMREMIG